MSEETKTNGHIFKMRIETSKLINLLKDGKIGDVLTDEKMTEVCGKSTESGEAGYGYLASAIRNVRKECNLVWERIPGAKAIKCIGPSEVITVAHRCRETLHRRAARTLCKIKSVATTAPCTDQEKNGLNIAAAHLGSIAVLSSSNAAKQLEARSVSKQIDMSKMLEAMK